MYRSFRCQAVLRLFAFIFAIFWAIALPGQEPKVFAPHQPVEPRVERPQVAPAPASLRSMVGGFWMTDANWKSSIYLTNDVASDAITATPVLYLSNGRKLTLPDVKLEASGTAVISINDALQQQNIAPWAALFGYVEVDYRWPWDALCVTVRNLDSAHSLIHTYYLQSTGAPPKGARRVQAALEANILEGLWWKQESGVTGFIALSNTLAQPVHAVVQVNDAAAKLIAEHSVTISPHGTKVVNLKELTSAGSSQGGVRITWEAPEGGLIVNGGLEDQAVGYSARLPLHFPPVASAETAQLRYAAVGLMSGAADPMMSFPAGTTFTPYTVVRNISAQPLSVTPTLWWMEGSMPHSARLQPVSLPPYNSRNLNLPELISKAGVKNFNGSLNLVIDADGKSRALLMSVGSVDQRNTYVFEVLSSGVIESVAKSLSYWSTRDGDDTMVTLWNPADEAQDFVFTLFFPGGHYRLPIHLEARVTRAFNVSEIIHNQIPDDEGNIIPVTAREGSAQIAGSNGENEHILISVDAGTYNVQKATCGNYCFTCQGAVNAFIFDNPFAVGVNGTHQLTLTVQYNNGATYNHTNIATWTSSNTTLATVSTGLVSGVSAGAVSMDGFSPNVPDYSQGCLGYNPDGFCPQSTGIDASGPGSVVNATVSCPAVTRGQSVTCTASAGSTTSFTTNSWKFTDSSNSSITVTGTNTGSTWSGTAVQGGTVSVNVNVNGTDYPAQTTLTVNARSGFQFSAVSPSQVLANTLTCYDGSVHTAPSPPSPGSIEGYSCADMAYSFQFATISGGGPNNGYEYVTSASDASGSQPTKYEYFVVSDLLSSSSTFYVSQCGNFSASNTSGFIAGSQLKQNVFDHEQGSVLSHWTEYRDAQNNNSNNIGIALEAAVGAPGSSGSSFATTPGDAARGRIAQAVAVEPCGGLVNQDSSQACKTCGAVNYSPYQSCGSTQPVPFCQ